MFHPTMTKMGRIIFYPVIRVFEWLGEKHPVMLVKIRYFLRFHKLPDLKEPRDLNEKILFLKLFTDTSKWTELADKYKVREYVTERGLEENLIPLVGMWASVDDIDFYNLPASFIFKANNGCGKGSNLIVEDVNALDITGTKRILQSWIDEKHIGALAAEPQYKGIPPCIIAEELLPREDGGKSPVDYKIWCFNGKAYYIWTCTNRDNNGTEVMTYDREWKPMPEVCVFESRYRKGRIMPRPDNLDQMLSAAECLSEPFPCVRVDLYSIQGKVYFGEMTFTSLGGMMDFYTPGFLLKMGQLVNLNYPVD